MSAATIEPALLSAVLDGREPAEALPGNPYAREQVVLWLVARGFDDREISARTAWSTYTVDRIRRRAAARRAGVRR